MTVDGWASEPHYLAHVAAVWRALPGRLRGRLHVPRRLASHPCVADLEVTVGRPASSGGPVLVAGWADSRLVDRRRRILVDHGAGQTYPTIPGHPCYPGGSRHDPHGLHLCPRREVADRWQARYPACTTAVVGGLLLPALLGVERRPVGPVWSFHWPCRVAREAGWAWPAWRNHLHVAGPARHGHASRARPHVDGALAAARVPHVDDLAAAISRATVWIADNTTSAFLAAACGVPVVWVDNPAWPPSQAPPRFTWALDGIPHAATPAELPAALDQALSGHCEAAYQRMAQRCWTWIDGRAPERAATAVAAWAATLTG
ncbi:MAG: hypothetical protein IPM45_18360 [Acidimicrobiales bacterium]|nr:hypothetical protein [Acidimicrobiales bacterium]